MDAIVTHRLKKPQDVPAAWISALRLVQHMFPRAVLAGGALRDFDHGIKAKDLDIFIDTPDEGGVIHLERAQRILSDNNLKGSVVDATVYAEWFGHETPLAGVIDLELPRTLPVQLVFGRFNPDTIFERFDFGLNQIMFDGKVIKKTVAYNHDFRERFFRMVTNGGDNQFMRRVERFCRLKAKYPDHRCHPGAYGEGLGRLADHQVLTLRGV